MNIDSIIGNCPVDKTVDLARAALEALNDQQALDLLCDWSLERDDWFADELLAQMEQRIEMRKEEEGELEQEKENQ